MAAAKGCKVFPRIKELRAYVVTAAVSGDQGADCHDVGQDHWINGALAPIACPMSVFPQYAERRTSWGINALGSIVVEAEADDGTVGVGVSIGGEPACFIVENHLSRFVEGEDPRNVEKMWEMMFRATLNYGRKGLPIQAISAVDLAIWDLLGKLRNEPVYALLGGKTKDRLPVYSTTGRPDLAKELGFVGAKMPCPYGPSAGDEGLRKNVEFVQGWRDKVGDDYPLMLDCYMALTVPYTIKLAKALEPTKIKWIEEFLPPDDYEGYSEVKAAIKGSGSGLMLTTAEHEYSRYGYRELIRRRCVDVLQPDITWLGGLTEARRIVAMAAAHDILVVPHGSSVYSYHLQFAFHNCPLAEYINLSPAADKIVPYFGGLFPDEPLPANGEIELPDKPGFGVTLDRSRLTRPYNRDPKESAANYKKNVEYKAPKPCMPF